VKKLAWISFAAFVLTACSKPPRVELPPPPPVVAGESGMRVTLTWDSPVDLDLYLTDPTWETLYFGNNPTRTGATLVQKASCGHDDAKPAVELARVFDPAPGPYRIGIDFIDACHSDLDQVPYRIVVDVDGQRREMTGEAGLARFDVVVMEFRLERGEDGHLVFAAP
jgi:hypothetical protein